ncbi:hypothetical protein JCM19376_06450 [Fusibacter bizertensis]
MNRHVVNDTKVEHVSSTDIKDKVNHKVKENMRTFEYWDWNSLESADMYDL